MKRKLLKSFVATLLLASARVCQAHCRPTTGVDPGIQFAPEVVPVLADHGLSTADVFRAMNVTSKFETHECWGAPSNPDAQLLSVGIMQWNLGKGSLQQLLKLYVAHFTNEEYRRFYIAKLMPTYGTPFFENCLSQRVTAACKDVLYMHWRDVGPDTPPRLKPDFAEELEALFNDVPMRQLQMDAYTRAFTSAVDDFRNIYHNEKPAYWQQAWAIDVKTQLGTRVLTQSAIRRIGRAVTSSSNAEAEFDSVMYFYKYLCSDIAIQHVNKKDCERNGDLWPIQKTRLTTAEQDRLLTLLYTRRIAETIDVANRGGQLRFGSGEWKLDAFTRKAALAIGTGYVHGDLIQD
jgi:hypothetical protein